MKKVKIILAVLSVFATGFTNPDHAENLAGDYNLFKIDRSRGPDIVVYDVRLDSQGKLDTSSPISVYWKKFTRDSIYEALTGIQKSEAWSQNPLYHDPAWQIIQN